MNYEFEITKLKKRIDELEGELLVTPRMFTPAEVIEARRQGMLKAAQIVDEMTHSAECSDNWSITRNVAFMAASQKIREVAGE